MAANLAAEASDQGQKPTARRDLLLEIQGAQQKRWEQSKLFEAEPPATDKDAPEGKFFGNFPYPYMNGLLHLGHAFSLSKLEFASAYARLCGKRVLFGQGFHCTGMPIKACADRLQREISTYGNPPRFPTEEEEAAANELAAEGNAEAAAAAANAAATKDPTKFSGKKSKAAAKKGTAATQWQILKQSGIPEEEIPQFSDTAHWLHYFPPLAKRDLQAMGCGIDWRRSFITTDMNPYYDSFVRWQFWTLYKRGYVIKDKRYAVYSPLDGQPCADHDRASGEGVGPQEYTLIKMKVLDFNGKLRELAGHAGKVFMLAATLRPETMYGQTNAWALPEGRYGAFKGLNDEVYIMTQRSAHNLSFQERTPTRGEPECLLELSGQDLIGTPLAAPNCPHERIFVLPLLTILTNKGTGIVTSVPSDSPDDYMALQDLVKKPKLREKYSVADEWVLPYDVIPIINIPGFGDRAAQLVCEQLKIQSQNDTAKLAEAKGQVYLKGFTDGVMIVGPYAGRKVSEAKPLIKEEMIRDGQALLYSEPERQVISRSGDECVVALTDQWYMTYGEEKWQAETLEALKALNTYSDESRHQFEHTMGWLQQWACSRSFGLGTRLPWDEQYLIESLSDSTIYMAYYTIVHKLQEGDMYGQQRGAGGITPEDLTNEVWDHIFLRGPLPSNSKLSEQKLSELRAEFEYWYPFDLRVSGKDLIQNHLTFALYNHVAMWPRDSATSAPSSQPEAGPSSSSSNGGVPGTMWPRGFRCNGHLLLNSEKMSKSTGNFKTLNEAILEYGADAMRWALADAGDGMDDANFETSTANAAILRMTKELAWAKEQLADGAGPSASATQDGNNVPAREAETDLHDCIFANELCIAKVAAMEAYGSMMFRDALKAAAYDLSNARDVYRYALGAAPMRHELAVRYLELFALLLAPITPHFSEHLWMDVLGNSCSVFQTWKLPNGLRHGLEGNTPDFIMRRAHVYIEDLISLVRKSIIKAEAPPKKKKPDTPLPPKVDHVDIYYAQRFIGWQEATLRALASKFDASKKAFAADVNAAVLEAVVRDGGDSVAGLNDKALKQLVMPFAKFKMEEAVAGGAQVLDLKLPFDEASLLGKNTMYLLRALNIRSLEVHAADAPGAPKEAAAAYPGAPVSLCSTRQ